MPHSKPLMTRWAYLIFLAIFLAGCGSAVPATPTQTAPVTEAVLPTPIPPTATATLVPPSPTSTLTATPSPSPTITPTSVPPSLVVNQNVTCLNGPGEVYGVRAYLAANTVPPLAGSTAERDWFLVKAPDIQADCWVSANFITLKGEVNLLTVLTPPPPPPPPPTATPVVTGLEIFPDRTQHGWSVRLWGRSGVFLFRDTQQRQRGGEYQGCIERPVTSADQESGGVL